MEDDDATPPPGDDATPATGDPVAVLTWTHAGDDLAEVTLPGGAVDER